MRLPLAPLLPLALSLGRIRADAVPRTTQLDFSDLPTEIKNGIFSNTDLVAYVTVLGTTRGAPLVTPDVELKLLGEAAEEAKYLDVYDDNQRARLSLILEATRAIIQQRSGLPTIIHLETDPTNLEQLAARFEITFLEYSSLSSSPTWSKFCMAALLGENTLIRLLPFISHGFVNSHEYVMLQAAAVVGDFDTLCAIADHSVRPSENLQWSIENDILFSGNAEFVQKIVALVPRLVSHSSLLLAKPIRMTHRSLFEYLYDETIKHSLDLCRLEKGIKSALQAVASRGWVDLFKRLHNKHPQCLCIKQCLEEAAKHGRINILKYLLMDNQILAEEAALYLDSAFEEAVASGAIKAVKFFLGNTESGKPLFPHLSLTRPIPEILAKVGRSGRWDTVEYLMQLKEQGDPRLSHFELRGNLDQAVRQVCNYGGLQFLKQLLKSNSQGQFSFHFEHEYTFSIGLYDACYRGHLSMVQELLKHPLADPAYHEHYTLIIACKSGNHRVVRELLRDGRVDASAQNNKSLITACEQGHLLVVRELLQRDDSAKYIYKVDPATCGNAALIAACGRGNLLVVRELLQHERVDPGANENEALIVACKFGHFLVVRELLQKDNDGKYIYNVDPAARNNQCLIAACSGGSLQIVEFLLQGRPNADRVMEYEHAGIDAAAQDNMPLLSAIRREHTNIVKFLLQKTSKGDSVFPRVAITEQMRWMATFLRDGELRKLLE